MNIPFDARLAVFCRPHVEAQRSRHTILEGLGPILEAENLYLLYVGALDEPPDGLFPGEGDLLRAMDERIVREGWGDRVKMLGLRVATFHD